MIPYVELARDAALAVDGKAVCRPHGHPAVSRDLVLEILDAHHRLVDARVVVRQDRIGLVDVVARGPGRAHEIGARLQHGRSVDHRLDGVIRATNSR